MVRGRRQLSLFLDLGHPCDGEDLIRSLQLVLTSLEILLGKHRLLGLLPLHEAFERALFSLVELALLLLIAGGSLLL